MNFYPRKVYGIYVLFIYLPILITTSHHHFPPSLSRSRCLMHAYSNLGLAGTRTDGEKLMRACVRKWIYAYIHIYMNQTCKYVGGDAYYILSLSRARASLRFVFQTRDSYAWRWMLVLKYELN